MIIRCPQCDYSRSITESKIPASAELATCPKCKHRFRFRILTPALEPDGAARADNTRLVAAAASAPAASMPVASMPAAPMRDAPEVHRPQSAFRESAREDIWDAVDALHQQWERQVEQNVSGAVLPPDDGALTAASDSRRVQLASSPDLGVSGSSSTRDTIPSGTIERAETLDPPPQDNGSSHPVSASADRNVQGPARADELPQAQGPVQRDDATGPGEKEQTVQNGGPHGAFLYADGGTDPEERVEQDLRMLHEQVQGRPMRDLGTLRDIGAPQSQSGHLSPSEAESRASLEPDQAFKPEESGIPWENPVLNGWLRGFIATMHGVMFRAPAFFSGINGGGSLTPGYLFFLIMGYVTILGSLAWSEAIAIILPGSLPFTFNRGALPVLLLLAPPALGLMLLFVTGWVRIALRLLAPDKAEFSTIYKIVSYSVAPFVLCIVPFVGPPLGALWFLAALVTGCRNALSLPWPLALAAPLPPALLLLFGLTCFFL